MKKLIIIVACFLGITSFQAQNKIPQAQGGEVVIPHNTKPCITSIQREAILQEIARNKVQLKADGKLQPLNKQGSHPLFIWPVSQADGFNYNAVWATTNYIDHNPAYPNQISDYECGTKSYDTNSGYNHKGFDIITWPFWWKQMDQDQAINIAAAEGQIIAKNDGSFDRNCSFNNDTPNYIAVEHIDGSTSWYLHMKNGGLTTKGVGDYVAEGEFLGVIGSSGSSTIPHLHFEVYDNEDNLIDPSIGLCNDFNDDTWWLSQKEYLNPQVNAAITHNNPPQFFDCPISEITNESNQFDVGDLVTFAIYLKDQEPGTSVNLKIVKPDNTFLYNWDFDLTNYYATSYWYWQNTLNIEGTWKWETTYLGETTSHTFNVGELAINDSFKNEIGVYPNPTYGNITVDLEENFAETTVSIYSILGQQTATYTFNNQQKLHFTLKENPGIYFIKISTSTGKTTTLKVVKK